MIITLKTHKKSVQTAFERLSNGQKRKNLQKPTKTHLKGGATLVYL